MAATNVSDPRSDEVVQKEAKARLVRGADHQFAQELITRLRAGGFAWWTPASLRERFPTRSRFRWLRGRPDIRQRITTDLCGLMPKAARKQAPELQADLIDAVLDEGDIDIVRYERAFEPEELAVHAPIGEIWQEFRKRVPWTDESAAHRELMAWLMKRLLADRSESGLTRAPILTPLQVRRGIPARTWQTTVPLEVRTAVDEARFRHEEKRPTEPFGADREIEIATPDVLAASVPLLDFKGVLDAAEIALGFGARPSTSTSTSVATPSVARAAKDRESRDLLPRDETFEFGQPRTPAQAK